MIGPCEGDIAVPKLPVQCANRGSHLTEVDIHDPKDHGDGELGSVNGEEPLGCIHVSLNSLINKVTM